MKNTIVKLMKLMMKLIRLYGLARSIRYRTRTLSKKFVHKKQRMLSFYSEILNPGDICFDVGANVGDYTEVFLDIGASVVAIEPQPECARELYTRYGKRSNLTIVRRALGSHEGIGKMLVGSTSVVSSMSVEWVRSVKNSCRFPDVKWIRSEEVLVSTLDELIAVYGTPAFVKIDVEGFEFEVLQGLSRPVNTISFEFTPEFMDHAIKCVQYLAALDKFRFNYCVGESMRFALPRRVDAHEMCEFLASLKNERFAGDIYASLADPS